MGIRVLYLGFGYRTGTYQSHKESVASIVHGELMTDMKGLGLRERPPHKLD
jgi:hypothetical protein